ncbi:putative SP-containing membrane protein [Vairimorpha necatrix]|uniref:SP-containing membrane protein n=1 Tax=Vairimorpha necatrix TaxID=6039 RepID=A0AAX4JAH4_9MICR
MIMLGFLFISFSKALTKLFFINKSFDQYSVYIAVTNPTREEVKRMYFFVDDDEFKQCLLSDDFEKMNFDLNHVPFYPLSREQIYDVLAKQSKMNHSIGKMFNNAYPMLTWMEDFVLFETTVKIDSQKKYYIKSINHLQAGSFDVLWSQSDSFEISENYLDMKINLDKFISTTVFEIYFYYHYLVSLHQKAFYYYTTNTLAPKEIDDSIFNYLEEEIEPADNNKTFKPKNYNVKISYPNRTEDKKSIRSPINDEKEPEKKDEKDFEKSNKVLLITIAILVLLLCYLIRNKFF